MFFTFQVIDEVDPAVLAEYEAMAQQYEQPQQAAQPRADSYVPASGPAYASPSMLNPVYANARSDLGPGQLEASVLAGAEAYGVAARPVSPSNKVLLARCSTFAVADFIPEVSWVRLLLEGMSGFPSPF